MEEEQSRYARWGRKVMQNASKAEIKSISESIGVDTYRVEEYLISASKGSVSANTLFVERFDLPLDGSVRASFVSYVTYKRREVQFIYLINTGGNLSGIAF